MTISLHPYTTTIINTKPPYSKSGVLARIDVNNERRYYLIAIAYNIRIKFTNAQSADEIQIRTSNDRRGDLLTVYIIPLVHITSHCINGKENNSRIKVNIDKNIATVTTYAVCVWVYNIINCMPKRRLHFDFYKFNYCKTDVMHPLTSSD